MSSSNSLKVFVCSDFHIVDSRTGEKNNTSFFDLSENKDKLPSTHFLKYVEDNNLKADIVIFCGDLGDKCSFNSAKVGWRFVHDLKEKLEASMLVATAGNHDLDSRFVNNDYDPKYSLQDLEPMFPIDDESLFNEYWARQVTVMSEDRDRYRIVTLNSSAFHGYNDNEKYKGRISESSLKFIQKKLEKSNNALVNILVVHHPPLEQSHDGQGIGDSIVNGDQLIKVLDSGDYGEWIILYGHKHYPQLSYANSQSVPSVLLSVASFSAFPHSVYGDKGSNQAHFLEFDLDYVRKNGLNGIVRTYDWTISDGWRPSLIGKGLYYKIGFGNRSSARRVTELIEQHVTKTTSWLELCEIVKEFNYLMPEFVNIVMKELEKSKKFSILKIQIEGEQNWQIQPNWYE